MAKSGISAEVEQFISEHITSVGQMETLLFLHNHADQAWSAVQLSKALYSQTESILTWLTGFERAGLLTAEETDQSLYRYAPGSAMLGRIVQQLDRDYKERKDAVIQRIFARPSRSLFSFAEAFRIRKDD